MRQVVLACILWFIPLLFCAAEEDKPQAPVAPDWGRMVEIGKKYGMPMPPAEASLILFDTDSSRSVPPESNRMLPVYAPGWLLEKAGDRSMVVLDGFERRTKEQREEKRPLFLPYSGAGADPTKYANDFDDVGMVMIAVQCAARGEIDRATEIWNHFQSQEYASDRFSGKMRLGSARDPYQFFASLLFNLQEMRLRDRENWEGVERAMAGILEDFPDLKDQDRALLHASVILANKAPKPEKGSVEDLLIRYGEKKEDTSCCESRKSLDDPEVQITRMGFAAIPELLSLSADIRPTVNRWGGFMMAPSHPKTLGDLAKEILHELLPEAEPVGGTAFAYNGNFEETWNKVRSKPEGNYYAEYAFLREEDGDLIESSGALTVLKAKFPDRLPEVVDSYLKTAKAADWPYLLSKALGDSSLPQEQKIQELLRLATAKGIGPRSSAIRVLWSLDQDAALKPALALVNALPREIPSKQYWTDRVAAVSHTILEIDHDEVWQVFFEKTRTASVGLRLEWMNPFTYLYLEDRLQSRRLAFLAGFLSDETVRKISDKPRYYEGPCAASSFPEISVRNFAAMQIAWILEMDRLSEPDPTWTSGQWKVLREKVGKALEEKGITAMKPR